MKLKNLWIDDFKNLKDFKIDFHEISVLDILIGKNGSGKSNLLEALLIIFGDLENNDKTSFNYRLEYKFENKNMKIESNKENILFIVNDKKISKKEYKFFLPINIIFYYSGLEKRAERYFTKSEERYKKEARKGNPKEFKRFIDIRKIHSKLLIFTLLVFKEGEIVSKILNQYLDIDSFEYIELNFKKPSWGDKDFYASTGKFWGPEGEVKEFMLSLDSCKIDEILNEDNYTMKFQDNDEFRKLHLDFKNVEEFFRKLENTNSSDLLKDLKINIKLTNGTIIDFNELSEGQKQLFVILSLLTIKGKNTLFLLDEPDCFLHPVWQFNLCKQIIQFTKTHIINSHILLNSHCASTLVSSTGEEITLFDIENDGIVTCDISKKDAINRLTEGYISLSEDESKLKIDTVIKNSNKPILFTEGITDEMILETAWKKLNPKKDISFLIQNAFSCSFLRNLIRDGKMFTKYPKKKFYAIFDFDKAYNDWNQLPGEIIENNPYRGLGKKLTDKDCHTFLIPVPANKDIKKMAIKNESTLETYKDNCDLTIELLFYGLEKTKEYFKEEISSGGGKKIKFIGDKVNFAENIIPTLPEEAFTLFSPIFSHIESHI